MPGPSNPPKGKAKKAAFAKRKRQEQVKKAKGKGKQKALPRLPSETSSDDDEQRKRAKRKDETTSILADEEEEEEEEVGFYANDKVTVACTCQGTRIGAAYYDPVKMIVYLLEDTMEGKHFDMLNLLLEQASPNIVLTSSSSDERSIGMIQDYADLHGGTCQVRPKKEFNPARGRDRLFSLSLFSEVPSVPYNLSDEAIMRDNARDSSSDPTQPRSSTHGEGRWIDPALKTWSANIRINSFTAIESSPLCISSAGVLLEHLTKVRALSSAESEGLSGLDVRGIETLALEQVMLINSDACLSLSIFCDENHANMHSKRKKEGLSLFGILNNTRTTLGRNLLRQWCLRPSRSHDVIHARHDAVECLVHPSNIVTADAMHGHLKGMKNVPRILKQLRSGTAKLTEWQGLVKFAFHAALLKEAVAELVDAAHVEILVKLSDVLDVNTFREVGNAIHEIIDWEESVHAARVCVRANIDEELDNWRHIYNGIDGVLSRVAEQISTTIPQDYATSLNVVYFPQLGFLVCVPMRDEWKSEQGVQVLEGWTFQFSSDSHVYFKNEQMRDMDHHIGDLHPSIVDREIEIMQALLDRIIVHAPTIALACDTCAELDCLLCFALAARTYNYVRPSMVEDNIIDIKQGRHPLQELVVDLYVPNDISICGGEGLGVVASRVNDEDTDKIRPYSVMVLTGANSCGKSVYLKQTALICHMAQIGCFVPAESATLGIVDKIFTRLHTRESVSKAQSAFMIDLNQVSYALRNCTSRSLLLLDEFGKGTLPTDGAALFVAVIKYLLRLGADCPKVLATTHFHEVFQDKLLNQTLPIAYMRMRVLLDGEELTEVDIDTDADELDETTVKSVSAITYLFKIAPGVCRDSYAAQCARKFGVPAHIVRRAQYVTNLLNNGQMQRLLDEQLSDQQLSELEEREAMVKRFLAWDLDAAQKQFDDGEITIVDIKRKIAEVLNVDWNPETGEVKKKQTKSCL